MYEISEISGYLYFNRVLVPKDDSVQSYLDYVEWLGQGNSPSFFSGTQEEIELINLKNEQINETNLYVKRQQDGVLAYAEISAEFRIAKLKGIITEESHKYIEKLLIPVRNEVLAGQWKSAKVELELIGVEQVGIELYNRLMSQIEDYILINYET